MLNLAIYSKLRGCDLVRREGVGLSPLSEIRKIVVTDITADLSDQVECLIKSECLKIALSCDLGKIPDRRTNIRTFNAPDLVIAKCIDCDLQRVICE